MFFSRVFLILAGTPFLYASEFDRGIAQKVDHGETATRTILTHNNKSGNCMGEDFIQCYENIIEYVTLGEEAIKVSHEKNAVIVIGLTRVGKSTLTQFIANETNPLFVSCSGTICQLIDDSGDGSDSVISKTFVPNTVEDGNTDGVLTPFYDMPGFDDTRNISVEIANSFFIQKVINNIEGIKIVIVAKHASFSSTETTFKTLLTFLIKFAKDPTKFRNSIVIISNFGLHGVEDSFHFQDMRRYMLAYNESMYGAESSHPDPQERATATAWINSFLDAREEEPDNLKRAAVFRTPVHGLNGTSIRNDSVYKNDLMRMKQLLWNETIFTPISPTDIGFTLSIEAELFLERATRESDTSIRNNLNGFALRTKAYFEDLICQMQTAPNQEGMTKLYTHITTLNGLNFPECNNLPDSGPRQCVNQIEAQLHAIATEMNDLVFTDINKTTNFLQFAFENIGKKKEYNMEDWVSAMYSNRYDIDLYFTRTALNVTSEIVKAIAELADDTHKYVLLEFEKLASDQIHDTIQILNETLSELLKFQTFVCCTGDESNYPVSCFQEIMDKTKLIRDVTSNNIAVKLQPAVTFLELACSEVKVCLELENWVGVLVSLKKLVVESLKNASIPEAISNILLTQLTDAAIQLKFQILHDVPNTATITDLLDHLVSAKAQTDDITRSLENYDSTESLHGYADLAVSAYKDLWNASIIAVCLDGINVLERLTIFPWYRSAWINFHKESLTLPVELEWRVSQFLSLLFNNLGAANVQVDDDGDVHQWRLDNPNLQEANFDQFWSDFDGFGIEAMRTFSAYREHIKEHINKYEHSRKWLNDLLDYTIKREQISCPIVNAGIAIFERKYLTLEFIYECLKNYAEKPKTILALAEHTFFFDINFKNPGTSEKFKLFVISRNFDYTRGQPINLNGEDGNPPQPKPNTPETPSQHGDAGVNGNVGTDASDFIGVYLTEIGNSSRVEITCQGGNGGNGQDGGNGADAVSTLAPNLGWGYDQRLGNNDCNAWDNNKIRVRRHPNNCNSEGEGTYCETKFVVNICGAEPREPGSGGTGGTHGVGGSGGYRVLLNVTYTYPSVTQFPFGSNGMNGQDGSRGKIGSWGAAELKIKGKYCASCVEYRCYVDSNVDYQKTCHKTWPHEPLNNTSLSRSQIPLQLECPGHRSQKSSSPISNKTLDYSLTEFKPYVKILIDNAAKTLNIFNRQDVTIFLDFVKRNSLLV